MEALAFALFWGLAIYGFFSKKKHVLLYILFGSMPFGTFAVIPPELTGGLTLMPTPIIAIIIILRTFFTKGGLDSFTVLALSKQNLLLLFLFWIVSIFTTLFMPRLFRGEVMVIPLRLTSYTYGIPLEPTSQNFSQLIYLTISIFAVFAFSIILKKPDMRKHGLYAVCLGAGISVFTGVIDFLNQYVAIDFFLDAFRNATYALLTNVEILSAKRVVGLMSEASLYGSLCLVFLASLYFLRRTFEYQRVRDVISPILIILLLLMVWLSTSSAAYVGLGLFGILVFFEKFLRLISKNESRVLKRGLSAEIWLFNITIIAILLTILIQASLFEPLIEMIDTMIFKKTESSSFEERSMWTAVSWQALLDTYGIGVGLGGTRASNGVVSLMSNVGFLGALFYYAFILQTFMRKAAKDDEYGNAIISALRWSFFPSFLVDFLIIPSADFGIFNAFRYGLIVAISSTAITKKKY